MPEIQFAEEKRQKINVRVWRCEQLNLYGSFDF